MKMTKLQRWSVGIDLEKGFYQRHDDEGHWAEYDKAADLIEQLQQRNAELEAHVERLTEIFEQGFNSGADHDLEAWESKSVAILKQTPQQSLNALKREVARESVNNFAHRLVTRHIDMTDIYTWADRFLDEDLDKYPTEGELWLLLTQKG